MSPRYPLLLSFLLLLLLSAPSADAALINDVNRAFRSVHGRNPSGTEWHHWAGRVQRKEKTTFTALVGAIAFQKNHGKKAPVSATVTAPAAGSFKTNATNYPSSAGPNFLPNGTLIKSNTNPAVYYVKDGKRSPVIGSVLNRWLTEAHFFSGAVVLTLSPQDFARYTPTDGRNPTYIGKVLVAPNGTQYYIDDKLRKRQLSASVRKALKFPGGNKYATTSSHLAQFPTGPALKGDRQPGGMIIYDGPYHGGRIWRIEERAGGKLFKRLYLGDYFYEAEFYPDENQRVAASAAELAKYTRGPNIGTPPDGWIIGIGNGRYVMQNGRRRQITSPKVLAAMGYSKQNVITAFPQFTSKAPVGTPITAYKTVVDTKGNAAAPAAAPSPTSGLTKVNSSARALIAGLNPIYREVYDKEITPSENRFWSDHIFNGEVRNRAELVDQMKRARATGKKPGRTCRTCEIDQGRLKERWFPFLFHHLHRRNPNEDEKRFWHRQIDAGRNTIQKLDSNMQWLWQNERKTHK